MQTDSSSHWWTGSGLAGVAVGLLWWLAYTPSLASLLLPVVVGHALAALSVGALLRFLGGKWAGAAPLVGSITVGLVLAPAVLTPLYRAGRIWGVSGLAWAIAIVGTGLVAGAVAGRMSAQGGAWHLAGWGGLLAIAALVVSLVLSAEVSGSTSAVACRTVEAEFPATPVLVLGVDCADWQVVQPHLDRGELPNLARLISEGRRGVLHSQESALSPVVWTSIFTGHEPEVHGITDWHHSDARNRVSPALWELFDGHGASSLVANVPGTWPPRALRHGMLVSGFPMPGMTRGGLRSLFGTVVSSEPSSGLAPTVRPTVDADGSFSFALALAPASSPRFPGIGNYFLDLAIRRHLAGAAARLEVVATAQGRSVRLSSPSFEKQAEVEVGAWTPWLVVRVSGIEAVIRFHAIEAGEGRLTLYASPPFQAPWRPRHPFVAGADLPELRDPTAPYIVEGIGWKAYLDGRVAPLVADLLLETESARARAVERLVESRRPQLVAYVMTVIDRVQHPWLALDRPELYASPPELPPAMQGRNPVSEAYRLMDDTLGRLVGLLPENALVFVVSDHGVAPGPDGAHAEHRPEGIWIARGPMVRPAAEPLDMGLLDVLPTLLHCLEIPGAEDLPGTARTALCPGVDAPPKIPTYSLDGDVVAPGVEIDREREDQLRSLGYLD